jgi:hypothetical protein
VEEHKGRWKEIGEFLGNLKRKEGKTSNQMQQIRHEVTQYLGADGVVCRRRKTTEPPAKVLVRTEKRSKMMEAAHKLSAHLRREGTLQNVVTWYWSPPMDVHIKDWVKMRKQCKKRVLLRCDELRKTITVSHL